ncbi:MAG TPA: hypothetical protein DCK96_14300 [Chloroflexi bacterium]|jgi:photosystem II stability/assembly factor-like uncharacterized protein|nr:hypothetical protein [Chloroflexota bacterium]
MAAISLFMSLSISVLGVSAATPKPPVPSSAGSQSSSPSVEGDPTGTRQAKPRTASPRQLSPALTTGGSWSWQNPKPNGNLLTAISCPAASTCFAAGQDSPILTTVNGGSTWSQQVRAAGVNSISCTSTTFCVAVGDFGLVMTTADAGSHWAAQTVNGGNFLAGVSCPTASVCFSVGYAGSILYSGNGGSTWTAQASGTTANLFGINCPSVSICYAVGAGGVITGTANGGTTWSVESSTTSLVLLAISCPSITTCAAVGAIGTIVSTTTGGTTWSLIGSETRANLFGISCPSTSLCFSAGDDGEVHVGFSVISGNASVGADGGLWAISCPTATECLTAGDFGTVAVTTNGGSGWSLQLQGLAGPVSGMSCPSTTTCFAFDQGTILGTTDGGSTWPQLFTSTLIYFNSISCPTTSVCFAAGLPYFNNAMLYATTDAGKTWNPELYPNPLVGQEHLTSISCATTTNCVAVDSSNTIGTTTDTITRTTDGVHWSSPTFGPCFGQCPGLIAVSCPTASVCFLITTAVPGQVWSSVDGGTNWVVSFDVANDPQAVSTGGFSAISCPSATVCYAVGPGPASPGPGGVYATTTDGGVTWRTDNGPSSTSVTGISCPSVSTCYVSATGASIFHTADYGGTWDVQLGNTNAWYFSVSCPTTTVCFAGGSGGAAGGIISATTTAGAAWTRPKPAGSTNSIFGVSCGSSSDCYAAALNNILVSHNGGSTWATQTLTTGDQVVGMKCASATTCYAVGWPGAIYKTIDSGTTWTYQANPLSGADTTLLGVSCWSLSACVAVGTDGDVLSTSDGTAWGLENSTTFNNLYGVSCPSSSTCVAVGTNGTALTRTGNSWHADPSGTTSSLAGVSCPSAASCYAVGQTGTVLMTNNQGSSWTAQSSGVTNVLTGIGCVRTYFCLASGTLGTALVTLDGSHWSALATPTINTLLGVAMPDPNHAWLVGNGGTILANASLFPWTCTAVTESAAPPSQAASGTSVVFTASASNCPNPLYQFWILAPGGTWTVAQAYSTTATLNWNTTGLAAGTYYVSVWVRDASSAGAYSSSSGTYDAYAPGVAYTLTTTACTSVTASAAPPSPSVPGTAITITGSASGCPNPRYEFWILAPGSSTWTIVQAYSSSAAFNWTTTGLAAGTYHFSVWARDASSAAAYDTYVPGFPYMLTSTACTAVTASAAPASPQVAGTAVTITASATGCASARYEFWTLAPGGSWMIAQAYSPSTTYSWTTTGLPAGTYYYSVWVRDAASAAAYDAYFPGTTYALTTTPCTSATVSAAPASPQAHGTTITISANASGCSNPLYEFWILAPGGSWTVVRAYSTTASFSWNTTGLPAGTYYYSVWVRDASSASSYDAYFPGTVYVLV